MDSLTYDHVTLPFIIDHDFLLQVKLWVSEFLEEFSPYGRTLMGSSKDLKLFR